MRRLLAVAGFVLVVAGLVGIYPHVEGWLSLTSMPPQPVAASTSPSLDSPSPTSVPTTPLQVPETQTPAIQPVVQPVASATPAWLSIPSIGIDESIAPMGLTSRGELEPPPGRTIWYKGSPKPGKPGVAIIAGHVQWGSQPDNFWRLSELPKGAPFSIRYSDGTVLDFEVVNSKSELKTDVQNDQAVWGPSKVPIVVLVTCDRDPKRSRLVNHHYTNNWLVFARPLK